MKWLNGWFGAFLGVFRVLPIYWGRLVGVVSTPLGFFRLAKVSYLGSGYPWRESGNQWVADGGTRTVYQYVEQITSGVVYRIPRRQEGEIWELTRFEMTFRILGTGLKVEDFHLYRVTEPEVDLAGEPLDVGGMPLELTGDLLRVTLPQDSDRRLNNGVGFLLRWTNPETGENQDLEIRPI